MTRGKRCIALLIAISVLTLFTHFALAQLLPYTTFADIDGLPSHVVLAHSGPSVIRGLRFHRQQETKLAVAVNKRQRDANRQVASSTSVRHVVQRVALTFVDERYHRPIGSLPITVTIETKSGRSSQILTTNSMGKITVPRISTLPAAVDIQVNPILLSGSKEPEWELANPQTASLVIQRASGQRVTQTEFPPAAYQIASASYAIPNASNRSTRFVIYQLDQSISLKRNYVDFQADIPQDAQVWCPTVSEVTQPHSESVTTGGGPKSNGETPIGLTRHGQTVQFTLPAAMFENGCVPLRISQENSAGVYDAVVTSYPDDPYSLNKITPEPLNLVAIKDISLPNGIDVLSSGSDIESVFPDLDKHAKGSNTDRSQGSDWWKSDFPAVSFRIRKSPFSNDEAQDLVECIRLDKADAGSVAGIRVGMPKQDVINTLGDGTETYNSVSYLDGGITFAFDGNTVKSIYVDRPRELLEQGTTAFVPRKPAKVFVKSFHVDGQWSRGMAISDLNGLKSYLVRTGVVELVNDEQDADYTLTCEASNFIEKKDVPLGVIPLQYKCGMTLTYSLKDNATAQMVYSDRSVSPDENVDFWKLLLPILTGVAVVNKVSHSNTANVIVDALGVAFVAALKDAADKADKACPRLVEQEAYSRMADDLYDAFDCRCRVTAINYNQGTLTMNIGTADGVVAEGDNRTTFEILVNTDRGPTALPSSEGGMSADYYVAEVLSAGDNSCTCALEHVTHSVKIRYGLFGKSYVADNTNVKNDIDILRRIPDPVTGIVSARIKSRLLSLRMPPTN